MPQSKRMTRINDELFKELSLIIRSQLKDPRLSADFSSIVTVTKAETTKDLQLCKVNVSVMGDAKQREEAMEGLKNAQGFIRKQLAQNLNLRNTPELRFALDDSLDRGLRIDSIINQINKGNTQ